VKELFD